MMQKVVDFDPTSPDIDNEQVRDAIRLYKSTMQFKANMWPAVAALHDWLAACFWVRKEMRAVAGIVQKTTVGGVINQIQAGDIVQVRNVLEVDLFTAEGVDEHGRTPLHHTALVGEDSE